MIEFEDGKLKTDWNILNYRIPDGYEKYVIMLAEAYHADSDIKIITRIQKVVRLIYDENVVGGEGLSDHLKKCDEIAEKVFKELNDDKKV